MVLIINLFFFQKSGIIVVSDPERDKQMVQELLELKDKVEKIIKESFQNENKFHQVVRVCTNGYCATTICVQYVTALHYIGFF